MNKYIESLLVILTFLIPQSSAFAEGVHLDARHCEIFIDKITPYQGSHAYRASAFYVKTLNSRLDGEIAEVGFWHSETDVRTGQVSAWNKSVLRSFMGAKDYFLMDLGFSSDYGGRTYTGNLYVKTDKGTTYWAKPFGSGSENFIFDNVTHDNVMNAGHMSYNYNSRAENGVSTQIPALKYFNPDKCF
jgi:hypothetical protein